MRKTKIVCTIGPACTDEATLEAMALAGMNVARLNFSHGTHADQLVRIQLIKRIREKIEDDPTNPTIIKTVRGMGYRVD